MIYLLSKGVFTKSKHEELANVDGCVRTIKWRCEFILWADDKCICVYDARDHRPITFIQYANQNVEPSSSSSYSGPTICCLSWCTDNCFLIGRGESIRICQIMERNYNPDRSLHSSRSSFSHQSSQSLTTTTATASSSATSDARIGLLSRYVEIVYQINMNGIIIHSISRHQACILLLYTSKAGCNAQDYEICVLDVDFDVGTPDSTLGIQQYKEIYREKLPIQSTDSSYSIGLASVPHENTHYIFSKKELICAQELTLDDRIDWFLENNLFLKGLQAAQQHPRLLSRHTIQSVGITYVDHLLSERKFDEAGKLCSEVLSTKDAWEEHVQKFHILGHLEAIVPYLPVGAEEKSVKLNISTYELVLFDYMKRIPIEFFHLLTNWCRLCVVNINENFIHTLLDCIEQRSSLSEAIDISKLDLDVQALYHSLAVAYEQMGSYEQAINILIRLRDTQVFSLLKRNSMKLKDRRLIDILKDHLVHFMELDSTQAIYMLLDHIDHVSVDYVVNQLNPDSIQLYQFLDTVYSRYPQIVYPYLTHLISLYIKFCRNKLLPLLRSTDKYPLSEALSLCERAKLVPETVYLLTRVGRRHDALQLIMTRGGEDLSNGKPTTQEQCQAIAAAKAIEYCREEDGIHTKSKHHFHRHLSNSTFEKDGDEDEGDENAGELWQQVILFAADKPAFICALLQNAGCEGLDSRLLLRKISPDMTIPGLRDALIKLMHDYKIQLELQQNCSRILASDMHQLFLRVIKMQMKGMRVNSSYLSTTGCIVCLQPILNNSNNNNNNNVQSRRRTDPLKSNDEYKSLQQQEENSYPWAIFQCSHICHEECLVNGGIKCPACSKSRII
uniref:Vps41 beta-propeller domain-containing protein n=1 Tax=Trichobilharzia regenti TaxID=157069 RepID=A0AA85K0E7_TRIRE|nr:unnamed protein product [Trichobilharzia regenti]